MRNVMSYAKVVVIGLALVAMVTSGTADAKRGGVGPTVEGSEVTDNTLTGADIDESTLQCGGPGGIPGCAAAAPTSGPGTPSTPTVTLANDATAQLGYPAIKTATATSTCPPGGRAIGANISFDNDREQDDAFIRESRLSGASDSWTVVAVSRVNTNNVVTLRVRAICLS